MKDKYQKIINNLEPELINSENYEELLEKKGWKYEGEKLYGSYAIERWNNSNLKMLLELEIPIYDYMTSNWRIGSDVRRICGIYGYQ